MTFPGTPWPASAGAPAAQELVFIESNVGDADALLQSLQAAGREAHLLDADRDGLDQIGALLQGRSGITALHLVTHGSPGAIDLGALRLDAAALDARSTDLQAIASHLAAGADILLYGCNVADGAGAALMAGLAAVTGADVAASDDLTGAAALGGDWELEVHQGPVETAPVVGPALAARYGHVLDLTNVTATFDSSSGTVASWGGSNPGDDVRFRMAGDPLFVLVVDGASDGVSTGGGEVRVGATGIFLPASTETLVTLSFADGNLFSLSSLRVYNDAFVDQRIVAQAWDAGNVQVAQSVFSLTPGGTWRPTFPDTDIARITLSLSSGGVLQNLYLDDVAFRVIRSVDRTAPVVTGVGSSASDGAYKAGDVIPIEVGFSEPVTVSGTPRLTLETGVADRVADYTGGSGSGTLTFSYTVQPGDTSPDLDYLSTAALALNGGTIGDSAGNAAVLTLPAPGAPGSLGASGNIVIDSTAPVVTGVTSGTANGSYNAGDLIQVHVNFSETVAVSGTPQLTLETGVTDRIASYVSGSGTSTLTFSYTVQAGDTSADLDYVGTAALALNGGGVRDAAWNNADLALPAPGTAGSLGASKSLRVDTTAPVVTNVSASAANGTYKEGDVIVVQVAINEATNIAGMPQLQLETGTTDRWVNLSGYTILRFPDGSGSSTLFFAYTVQAGDLSADLDYQGTQSFALNGGAVRDDAGNDLVLALPPPGAAGSLGANKAIVIDAVGPEVTSVTSGTADGMHLAGDVITIEVNFSEPAVVTGTPQLALETGAVDRSASYAAGSGTTTLTFSYTVQPGDASADLDYIASSALTTAGGSIRDSLGNSALLVLPVPGAPGSLGANQALVVDAQGPAVTALTSSTPDGAYRVGDVITLQVNFSEPVLVTGTPQLTLETGGIDRVVDYTGGSGTTALSFLYTVQTGDTSADLDAIGIAALALQGGTLRDAAGNDATLALPAPGAAGSLGANQALVVDGVAPAVAGVSASAADGIHGTGDVILVQVRFSETVLVTGTPQLTLETGNTDRIADYVGGSGSATLDFRYTVQTGDSSPDLDYVAAGALALNGGTIRDAAGNPASLGLPAPGAPGSLGASKGIVILTWQNAPGSAGGIGDGTGELAGTPEPGMILSFDQSTIRDPDGWSGGPVVYQWLRDGSPIAGATQSFYLVGPADVGGTLSLQVSYVDGAQQHESLLLRTGGPVADGDGLSREIELAVPALLVPGVPGDGNGDGLVDAYQPDVLSAAVDDPAATTPVGLTLVADSRQGLIDSLDANRAVLDAVSVSPVAGPSPANILYGAVLHFSVQVGTPGITETFSFFAPAPASGAGRAFWVQGGDGHWQDVTAAVEPVGGSVRMDFALTDGGALDADGVADGVIRFTGVVADAPLDIVGVAPAALVNPSSGP